MSYTMNWLYMLVSFLNISLICLSYKFRMSFTLYPAFILIILRCQVRLIDLEGTRNMHTFYYWE